MTAHNFSMLWVAWANLWWSLCWAMTCFHQQFVTVNPLNCMSFFYFGSPFATLRSILFGKLLRLFPIVFQFWWFASPTFHAGLFFLSRFCRVFFRVVCLILWEIFFILIVSILCQSDLMNVIQDKMLLLFSLSSVCMWNCFSSGSSSFYLLLFVYVLLYFLSACSVQWFSFVL